MSSEVLATCQVQESLLETLKNFHLEDGQLASLQNIARQCRDILFGTDDTLIREKKKKTNADIIRIRLDGLRRTLGVFRPQLNSLYTSTVLQ